MQHKDMTIVRDGLHLAATIDSDNSTDFSTPHDVALVFHGFTGNKDESLIVDCAQAAVKAGMIAIRLNFNGQGTSEGEFKHMTVANEVSDANALLERVLDGSLGITPRKIILIGHSQGGVIASLLAGLYPNVVSAVALLAPAAILVDDAVCGNTRGLTYDPRHIPQKLPFGSLTLGGFYLRVAQVLPIYQIAARFDGPACLIHGSSDNVVSPKASLRYRRAFHQPSLHILEGADHIFSGSAHDKAVRLVSEFLAGQHSH